MRRIGASWLSFGMMVGVIGVGPAGRADAAMIVVAPTTGLLQTTFAASSPPVVTYAGTGGSGFLIGAEGRSAAFSSEVSMFALPTPPSGEGITGGTLNFTVPSWQQTVLPVPLPLSVGIFGSSSSVASPADFSAGTTGGFSVTLPYPPTGPLSFSVDISPAIRAIALGNPDVGVHFTFGGANGNITVTAVQLVVSTGAVPEPASLTLVVGMAGVGGAGAWLARRSRA